mgnify:CR=1 FL=1
MEKLINEFSFGLFFWQSLIFIGLILSSLIACTGKQPYYEEYITIPDESWHQSNVPFFEFEIKDTRQRYDLFFNIRHAKTYRSADSVVIQARTTEAGVQDPLSH